MASGTINKYMDGTDSGWALLPLSDNWTGSIYYRRVGDIFILKNTGWAKCAVAINSGSNSLVGTIPTSDRPGTVIGFAMLNGSGNPLLMAKIENGALRLFNSTDATIVANSNFLFNVMTVIKSS